MEINRKQLLLSVLDTVWCVSDKDYQKRVWILGNGPEVDDYDETVCNFFGDAKPIIDQHKKYLLTQNQFKVFHDFYIDFSSFEDSVGINYSVPEEFIDTPEWAKVMESAKEVLKAFDYKKK